MLLPMQKSFPEFGKDAADLTVTSQVRLQCFSDKENLSSEINIGWYREVHLGLVSSSCL